MHAPPPNFDRLRRSLLEARAHASLSRALVPALIGIISATSFAWAQGSLATLNGTVLDGTGAALPGATVVLSSNATDIEARAVTTLAGAYTFPYLDSGVYTLRVSAPGFRETMLDVVLHVGEILTLNPKLELDQRSERITVSAIPVLLENGTAEVGRYISGEAYENWPIFVDNGQRQIQNFIFTSLPGTTGGSYQGSINGGQQYSHEILIDGISVGRGDIAGGNTVDFSPSAEAIGELKLQAGAIGAQYNGGQTAIANFSIKSGTNHLHGSAFWYALNESLNAKPLAEKTLGKPKARNRENNVGYSLGGPLYVPKVYDGRNRTFFFTNFEKDHRDDFRINGFTTFAAEAFQEGDFSKLFNPDWTGNPRSGTQIGADALGRPIIFGQIYDPRTTRRLQNGDIVRDPFPGNIIPKSVWDPVTANVIDRVGLVTPTQDKMVRNVERLECCPFFALHIIGVKTDHNFSDNEHLSAFYNFSYRFMDIGGTAGTLPIPGPPTSQWEQQFTPGHMFRLSLNSVLKPTIMNRLSAGYNRYRAQIGPPADTLNRDWAGKIGIQNTSAVSFPRFGFGGTEYQGGSIRAIGLGGLADDANGSWIVNDDLNCVRDAHSFHFGYEYRRYYFNERNFSGSGNFTFTPQATALPGFANQTGHAFASFLLGGVNRAMRIVSALSDGFRQPLHSLYAADDWKITPKLTLNAGLRWEIITPFYERTGRMSYIDLNLPNPGASDRLGALVFRNRPSNTYPREFGPRLGFAYQPAHKFVMRAGYGIMNTPPIRNDWGYSGFTYGYSGVITVRPGTAPTGFVDDPSMYLSQRFPNLKKTLPDKDPAAGNWAAYQTTAPNANRPGYTQNWDLTMQFQFAAQMVAEFAYIGNKGTRVWGGSSAFGEMNGLPTTLLQMGDLLRDSVYAHPQFRPFSDFPGELTVAQALRPYPQYNSVQEAFPYDTNSNYNALQVTLTRQYSNGLGFLAAYTWSKAIGYSDNNGPAEYLGYSPGVSVQDYYNRGLERSITTFNHPQSFKLTWRYDIPFGKNRRWDLSCLKTVFGGWQLAAIQNYRSGDPITVNESGLNSPDGFSSTIRPDLIFGQKLVLGPAPTKVDFFNATPYLNPAAFATSPITGNGVPLRVGTAPRVISGLRGPHAIDEKFRMSKKLRIRERADAGIGVTISNPLNRTTRYLVSNTVGDSAFGRLLAGGNGRVVQLDARVQW